MNSSGCQPAWMKRINLLKAVNSLKIRSAMSWSSIWERNLLARRSRRLSRPSVLKGRSGPFHWQRRGKETKRSRFSSVKKIRIGFKPDILSKLR